MLLPALAAAGIEATPRLWNDKSVRWQEFDAVVLRSTWDYYLKPDAFKAWLRALAEAGVRVQNPVDVVLANMDKVYLRDLARRGVRIVPTEWLAPMDGISAADWVRSLPWSDVVVKPTVSAGAHRTHKTTREALLRDPAPLVEILRDASVMAQPFLQEIVRDGEWSFLYFGAEYSHAVLKKPKAGDFRVQWTHGGSHAATQPTPELRRDVDGIFKLLPGSRLYTRIDGVVLSGRFHVVEVELIEPYLFLAEDSASPARFAKALTGVF